MKTTTALLALAGSAAAFTPQSSSVVSPPNVIASHRELKANC